MQIPASQSSLTRPVNRVKSRVNNKTPKILDQDIKDYVHI